ncbi:IS701 family transposase [Streptomyces glaucosporus]|uniref:IS701 family transposase n=1 Tax=Streptomyces glaucosporus TaxID=284044 RepID=A0ABN3HKD0_9ACTN
MEEIAELISHRFVRAEPRRRVVAYMEGLLSHAQRKNAFALASHAREVGPDGMQRLLRTAKWDPHAVRDDLRTYVMRHTREEGSDGVLVVSPEVFVKKGRHSAGVAWQYSSRHGRMQNCQIGLFLGHVSARGAGIVDRELYLPREWLDRGTPGIVHGVPEGSGYTAKAGLSRRMIARALESGLRSPWVSVPDDDLWDEELRTWLDGLNVPYVLRLRPDDAAALAPRGTAGEPLRAPGRRGSGPGLNTLPWQTVRLRRTSGERALWLLTHHPAPSERPASFLCSGPAGTAIPEFIRAVRAQATARRCLDALRSDAGLHEYQVRTVTGWYRHTTLSLLAHAFRSFAPGGRPRAVDVPA